MSFHREQNRSLRISAWALNVPVSSLTEWDKAFDKEMRPIEKPDKRGKASKATPELVRLIVEKAREMKAQEKQIRIKDFTEKLAKEMGLALSLKTVGEILIANGFRKPSTRKRRPRFYQSLRRRIPNGLLSFDGGEFTVFVDGLPVKLNVELGVDVGTFTHTAFSIGKTESTDSVLDVLKTHIREWGCPIGIVCDHGSANMSAAVAAHIKPLGVEFVPAGPRNPKGNGTLEGAFSQMKQVIGTIRIDASSPEKLARSVLEAIVSVYIKMRNKLPLRLRKDSPLENFNNPATQEDIDSERRRLKRHKESKVRNAEDQSKIDRVHFLIKNKNIPCEPEAIDRAKKTVIRYDIKAIIEAEEAFIKAVNRKPERLSLPYFFGILKNVQQERDDSAYKEYCRRKYNYEQMLESERRSEQMEKKPPTIEQILEMVERGMTLSSRAIRRVCLKSAQRWTNELLEGKQYLEPLRKRFVEAIGKIYHLGNEQKEQMMEYINQFLNQKSETDRVT